jgi:hypothetical protein
VGVGVGVGVGAIWVCQKRNRHMFKFSCMPGTFCFWLSVFKLSFVLVRSFPSGNSFNPGTSNGYDFPTSFTSEVFDNLHRFMSSIAHSAMA